MATSIEFTQTYDAAAAEVRAMLTDPAYARERGERTGATSVTVDVTHEADGRTRVEIVRVLPADVPSFAKSFVGDTLTITEEQSWHAPAADGSGTATITATFSAPLTFAGRMTITSVGATTTVETIGDVKANVPFVGGKVEQVAKDTMLKYLRKEQEIGADWLSR